MVQPFSKIRVLENGAPLLSENGTKVGGSRLPARHLHLRHYTAVNTEQGSVILTFNTPDKHLVLGFY